MKYKPDMSQYDTEIIARNWKVGFIIITTVIACGVVIQNNFQPLFILILSSIALGALFVWRVQKTSEKNIQLIEEAWLNIDNGILSFGNSTLYEEVKLNNLKSVRLDKVGYRDVILTFTDKPEIIIPNYERPSDIVMELSKYIINSQPFIDGK